VEPPADGFLKEFELASLPMSRDEDRLLYSMGWETANIHSGSTRAVPLIRRDLEKRGGKWLHKAAKTMLKAFERDWKEWKDR